MEELDKASFVVVSVIIAAATSAIVSGVVGGGGEHVITSNIVFTFRFPHYLLFSRHAPAGEIERNILLPDSRLSRKTLPKIQIDP